MQPNSKKNVEMWRFGVEEVFYSAIGAAFYMVLEVATNFLRIPTVHYISFRPAAVVPLFFGVVFGPWVGLLSGLGGNLFGDLMSGYGFWPWWNLGNGLMGFLPGLLWLSLRNYRESRALLKIEGLLVLGAALGMGLASLSEIWVSHVSLVETVKANFLPNFISNSLNGLVFVPLLLLAYQVIQERKDH